MFRKITLVSILLILSYGFWLSPNLKQISAGVAIFLFGMLALGEGFRTFTGGLLEKLLRNTTNKLWKSLSFGIVSTTLMQSSSLVSVITISFLSAGLISLYSGIGIIFGANLGTTTGAWLIAGYGLKINISAYAMPMLVFGIILVLQKSKELKGIGFLLAGLGFLFLGIHFIKEGFETFRQDIDLTTYAVSGYTGLFLYTLVGIVATVIMQSSHATLVLIITALAGQQITYENALALAIGSNIGTTITAILGAIGASTSGKRLAAAHLAFNLITGAVAIGFIHQLTYLVDLMANKLSIAADNYTLKLAVFHSLFNLIGILLMLPLTSKLVHLLRALIPTKKSSMDEPLYLHTASVEHPDTVLQAVRKETMNLYDYFFGVICRSLNFRIRDIHSDKPIKEIITPDRETITIDIEEEYADHIKAIYAQIVTFISRAQVHLSQRQSNEIFELRSAGRNMLEAVKATKHLHKNLSQHMNSHNRYVSDEYNKIRYRLASILRRLSDISNGSDEEGTELLTLDMIKREMEMADHHFFTDIDQLIREKHITGEMAGSLMNDNTYAKSIAENLLEIGDLLFKSSDSALRETQESLILSDQEIVEALAKRKHSHPSNKVMKNENY